MPTYTLEDRYGMVAMSSAGVVVGIPLCSGRISGYYVSMGGAIQGVVCGRCLVLYDACRVCHAQGGRGLSHVY